ncbi:MULTISPECIES: response regulator [Stenotrophomonas]|jgi:CheY-like chemotaxis protein|uniref:Response regulator n=1 Tax=Stenotrophomonas aracearum TaxID=3003272 RepID=A0ABY9YCU3_9GAMM|nr:MULTISPECIES: response regulator [unclassified Stenotrophomonas]RRU16122.1 response regulator [Stenotrophomonas sp. 278]WNH48498.1 response regulator [Stenotrophomonas sp. A5588]
MKILLIEDDADKSAEIRAFVMELVQGVDVDEARSFNSALKAICNRSVTYDAVLLDMSMPNFDVGADEPSGGAQENFAGRDLLMQMKMRQRTMPTIIVTMFDGFGEGQSRVSIEDIASEMKRTFPNFYLGHVYYSQTEDAWKGRLTELLKGILN